MEYFETNYIGEWLNKTSNVRQKTTFGINGMLQNQTKNE